MFFVECSEIRKRVFTDNVGVQNKERRIILSKNFFRKLEGSSSAKRFGFD
jgi:hypothetical protein